MAVEKVLNVTGFGIYLKFLPGSLRFFIVNSSMFFPCQVVIFVGECEKFALKDSNVRTFKCHEEVVKFTDLTRAMPNAHLIGIVFQHYCDTILGNHENMNEVKSADLVIGDAMYLCSFLIADKFSLPHVTILMSPLSTATMGFPYNFAELPSYLPQYHSGMTDDMHFLQRAKNCLQWLFNRNVFPSLLHKAYVGVKEKYNITPEKTLQQTFQNVDLILVQTHPIDYPRPHLPSKRIFFYTDLKSNNSFYEELYVSSPTQ